MAALISFHDGVNPAEVGTIERDNSFLGVAFTLGNYDNAGVLGWRWTLVDKPMGSAAALTLPNSAATGLVPDVVGSYLVRLETFKDAARTIPDDADQQLIGIAFAAPYDWQIPAAQETTERGTRGWASIREEAIRDIHEALGRIGDTTLQAAYEGGNTIEVTASDGSVELRNAPPSGGGPGFEDSLPLLKIERSVPGAAFVVADALSAKLTISTATRTLAAFTPDSGSAIRVDQSADGFALNVVADSDPLEHAIRIADSVNDLEAQVSQRGIAYSGLGGPFEITGVGRAGAWSSDSKIAIQSTVGAADAITLAALSAGGSGTVSFQFGTTEGPLEVLRVTRSELLPILPTYNVGAPLARVNTVYANTLDVAALLVGDGTVSLPSYAFKADPTSGIWRDPAEPAVAISAGGVEVARFLAPGGGDPQLNIPLGTPAKPSLVFGSTVSGFYSASNQVGVSYGGVARWSFGSNTFHSLTAGTTSYIRIQGVNSSLAIGGRADLATSSAPTLVVENYANLAFIGADIEQRLVSLKAIVNQTGTASFTALDVDVTRTALGSGAQRFLSLKADGALYFEVSSRATSPGRVRGPDGDLANPTYSFLSNTGTGMALSATRGLQLAYNGSEKVRIDSGQVVHEAPTRIQAGAQAAPGLTFEDDNSTGIYRPSAGSLAISSAGSQVVSFSGMQVLASDGSESEPSYSFGGDPNTGWYLRDGISLSVGGTRHLHAEAGVTTLTSLLRVQAGSVAAPAIAAEAYPQAGLRWVSANEIRFTIANFDRLLVDLETLAPAPGMEVSCGTNENRWQEIHTHQASVRTLNNLTGWDTFPASAAHRITVSRQIPEGMEHLLELELHENSVTALVARVILCEEGNESNYNVFTQQLVLVDDGSNLHIPTIDNIVPATGSLGAVLNWTTDGGRLLILEVWLDGAKAFATGWIDYQSLKYNGS